MANEEHLALLLKGVAVWNQWRTNHPEGVPDLSGANLYQRYLRESNLRGVKLDGADLREADLHRADLFGTDLNGANLREADIRDAHLGAANLSGADLSEADLHGTTLYGANLCGATLNETNLGVVNLSEANLNGADVSGATMGYTLLTHINLNATKGLETVKHAAPSSVGIDTIYLSKGNIPQVFLRGAGVPDNFIEYMGSLVGKGFEYYSCFISYSTKDQEFAERLYADLQAKGVRCWFAPHHIQGGKKLHEQIDDAIRVHERLLLILSPGSINSEWVKTEIAKARKREVRDRTRVLFPVRMGISFDQLRDWEYFDADIGKDSAREIREYYIPDFSQWKSHDSYQEEFAKLVRDLTKA